ncbi:hypothetical protein ACFX10_045058 [Malus domestica]
MAEADTVATLEMDGRGQVIQSFPSKKITLERTWNGIKSDNLITFNGGYQMTLLPGGMYMGCLCDIGNNVAES